MISMFRIRIRLSALHSDPEGLKYASIRYIQLAFHHGGGSVEANRLSVYRPGQRRLYHNWIPIVLVSRAAALIFLFSPCQHLAVLIGCVTGISLASPKCRYTCQTFHSKRLGLRIVVIPLPDRAVVLSINKRLDPVLISWISFNPFTTAGACCFVFTFHLSTVPFSCSRNTSYQCAAIPVMEEATRGLTSRNSRSRRNRS